MNKEVLHNFEHFKSRSVATLFAVGALAFSACGGSESESATTAPAGPIEGSPELIEEGGAPATDGYLSPRDQAMQDCIASLEGGKYSDATMEYFDENGEVHFVSC